MTTSNEPVLTPDHVYRIFQECQTDTGIEIRGIVNAAIFNPAAIASHQDEIRDLVAELPDEFRRSGGGGWSFLNACFDRHGQQWTGEHRTMEMLFMLGIAAGVVTEQLPRELWVQLPGGMPYYCVDL
jgi:hypothetical protein